MAGQGSEASSLACSNAHPAGVRDLTPERWLQVKELFSAAQERDPADRTAFLVEACGGDESLRAEVESLLKAAELAPATSDSELSESDGSSAASPRPDPLIGRRIGSYKIERQIGRGGMASVYLASRADEQFDKQVAIKILLPELDRDDLLQRFRAERQTLAALDHPNIVKLLDGGNTDQGLPYLVMDYVEGEPIDEFCDSRKLSTNSRLRLFRQVCLAVQCAHDNHVIHRDLKPSNILVTAQGIPKLLDFGIAKVLASSGDSQALITQTRTRRMTPAYASPEQVKAEPITTATDVYSLGVILYELLTGHRPYKLKQNTPAEIERAICEEDPEKPSTAVDRVETTSSAQGITVTKTPETVSQTRDGHPDKLRRSLQGDLDTILLKALQKEPQRRYASTSELSEDIQRHLDHLPVKARPSTFRYRISKFARRHKSEVIAAAAIILVLAGAFGVSVWQQRRAAERARAELVSQRSGGRRSVAVLGFKNLSTRADTAWLSTALSEMLTTELSADGKLRTIPGENVAQTRINLSLLETDSLSRETLNRVYKNMGSDLVVVGSYLDMGGTDGNIRLDLRVQDAGLGETIASMAETGSETSLPDLVTRAGADLRAKLGISAISPVESSAARAAFTSDPEATRLFAQGVARLRVYDALGARELLEKALVADPSFALAHSALAQAWSGLGYQTKATDEARKALDLATNLAREQHLWIEGRYYETSGAWDKAVDVFRTLFNFFPDNLDYGLHLAKAETEAGKLDESQRTIDALRKTALGARDPRVDITEADVAQNRPDYKQELEAAKQAQKKAEAIGARLLVAQSLYIQAHGTGLMGDPRKSMALASEARQIFASVGDRYREAHVLMAIGNASVRSDDLASAQKAYLQAFETYREIGNKADESNALMALGTVHLFQRDLSGAIDSYHKSLALARELGGPGAGATILHNLGLAEKDAGHLARARQDFEEALPIARRDGDQGLIAGCLINLAHVLAAQGDMPQAKRLAHDSVQARQSSSKPRLAEIMVESADVQLTGGDVKTAEKLYSQGLQIFTDAKQDFYASSALFGLGDVMMIRDDLFGARKKHEAALASRQKEHGSVRELFDSRIRMAQLALEQGQPADAEAGVRDALNDYAAKDEPSARIEADEVLVRSLVAQGKLPQAQEIVNSDKNFMAQSEDWFSRISFNIVSSELLTASGNAKEAIQPLQVCVEKSKKSGFSQLELEARLALGEAEIKAGQSTAARSELSSLLHDARARGFLLIARKTTSAARNTKQARTARSRGE